ncbi:hypothetical protein ACFV6F_01645 [Kitasatospora phosalacinea]|uniref:hypothetical protein n=1 Tax=Kitasatospora phosalacinea TaxID=2065 RepID=UPI003666D6EB
MSALLAEFDAYLDREGADPVADRVGYRRHALWLTPAELACLIGELRAAVAPDRPTLPPPDGRSTCSARSTSPWEPPSRARARNGRSTDEHRRIAHGRTSAAATGCTVEGRRRSTGGRMSDRD